MTAQHAHEHASALPATARESAPPVTIRFEGRSIRAREGQSIAGALHATGLRTISRGAKYHTPRGYTCGFGACGDCLLTVDGLPGTASCVTPVRDGQEVSREQGLPSTGFDLLRAADLMRPLLGAGFQFRLFAKHPRLSALAGRVLAVLAGGGRMPTRSASQAATVTHVDRRTTHVAVIGGGLSGLTAALAVASLGRSVTVVDRDFSGGRSGVRTECITDGDRPISPPLEHARLLALARTDSRISLLPGMAIGWIDGLLPVVGESTRTELQPENVVIATGSYETPLLFPNHDRPGVMFADAALRLAEIESVRPGRRAVVVSGDPRSAGVVDRLRARGVDVREIVEAGTVQRVFGWARARGIVVMDGAGGSRRIRVDLVVVVGPRRPAEELALQLAYAEAGSPEQVDSDLVELGRSVVRVGSSTGESAYSLDAVRETIAGLLDATTQSVRSADTR